QQPSGNTCSEFFGIMSHNLPLSDAPRLTQNFGREATTILTQGDGNDPKFIFHLLKKFDLKRFATGTGVPTLNRNFVHDELVNVPPLPEQQRIVSILDEAFASIAIAKANAEKNLQNARALFESHLQSVFTQHGEGWVEKKLKDVCEKITDGTHQTPSYFDEGVLFLSSRNVTSGKINWGKIKYIDTKQHLEMHKRVAPRINDILLAKNGTTGVAAIVDRDVVFDIYVSLALLRALDVILPSFLLYFINSPVAKEQFNKRLKGSGVPNLHLQEIREVMVSFPKSLAKQKTVVSKLDALSAETQRLEAIYQQKLAALDALKKSLLDQAFTGAL
ncbi:MAG: restriction endonuclease subunit S, partial [Geobacteraceae bacterium]|nr:restriction endonuclease subunit S [Geobacteraceae bacterium]